jgi:hypothetical protein
MQKNQNVTTHKKSAYWWMCSLNCFDSHNNINFKPYPKWFRWSIFVSINWFSWRGGIKGKNVQLRQNRINARKDKDKIDELKCLGILINLW